MNEFNKLKKKVQKITVEDKYGKFLDELILKGDKRGEDESWDIRYFWENTDFCKDSAKDFLEKIEKQFTDHQKLHEDLKRRQPIKGNGFSVNKLRRIFGSFCIYLYSSLDSFAHEINIFYEINIKRRYVNIKGIEAKLKKEEKGIELQKHLQQLSDKKFQILFGYRNAIAHGYMFPLKLSQRGFFIKEEPRNSPFSFQDMNENLLSFCRDIYPKVEDFINNGWRRFGIDELT